MRFWIVAGFVSLALAGPCNAVERRYVEAGGALFCESSGDVELILRDGVRALARGDAKSTCSFLPEQTAYDVIDADLGTSSPVKLILSVVQFPERGARVGILMFPR